MLKVVRSTSVSALMLGMLLLMGCQSDPRQMAEGLFERITDTQNISASADKDVQGPEDENPVEPPNDPTVEIQESTVGPATLPEGEIIGQESEHVSSDAMTYRVNDGVREPWNSPYEVFGDRYEVNRDSQGYVEVGIASWYGPKFHGRKTSNGEVFDMQGLSAAHKTLPIPTMVRVTNLDNGRKIDVRINDRGPFHDDRIIDLSFAAAKALGFSKQGTAPVVVEALDAVNYPVEGKVKSETPPKVYIQAGAFQSLSSANNLKRNIEANFMLQRLKAPVRVLQSEFETDSILHKVWIGPIKQTKTEDTVTAILVQMGLNKPVKVVAN